MEMDESDVIKTFMSLRGAIPMEYEKDRPIIFVPGSRKSSRVLLIAHYDTVFRSGARKKHDPIRTKKDGFVISSDIPGRGIGADDRLGCALLWSLRKSGHSLLLVPDEECGCKGSRMVAARYKDRIGDHVFMMQFDRRGSHDLVYYNYDNKDFHDLLSKAYPSYSKAHGSSTDVKQLIPALGLHGVNISIGFRNEHYQHEHVDMLDYIRTAQYTMDFLSNEQLPQFIYTAPVYKTAARKTGTPVNYNPNYTPYKGEPKNLPVPPGKISSWVKLPVETTAKPKEDNGSMETGFRSEAELMDDGTATMHRPDGTTSTIPLRSAVQHALSEGELAKIKESLNDVKSYPCPKCRAQIPHDLQIHCLDGRVICSMCMSELESVDESIAATIRAVNVQLIHDNRAANGGVLLHGVK